MLYYREIEDKIRRLAAHFPAVVLTGARQVGKTTLLRNLFKDHTYVTLDLPRNAQLAEEEPDAFLRRYPAPVLIDEVQYAPKLFRHLKVAIDEERSKNGQYILTGSQKLTLMKEVSDSLAGRCGVAELEGVSVDELGKDFSAMLRERLISHILIRGFYPQLWKDQDLTPTDFYSSYIATYIERDVRQVLNVVSIRDFERFMRACAIRSGQLLNKSEISKEVGITQVTTNDWLSVLHATNQVLMLEPYFGNIGKRLTKSPKLYFTDPGLLCALLGLTESGLEANYLIGHIWETFVYAELRKELRRQAERATIWFYRDKSREIDFLVDYNGEQSLIECKWTEIPDEKSFANFSKVAAELSNANVDYSVICRTQDDFPLSPGRYAISGFKISDFVRTRIAKS